MLNTPGEDEDAYVVCVKCGEANPPAASKCSQCNTAFSGEVCSDSSDINKHREPETVSGVSHKQKSADKDLLFNKPNLSKQPTPENDINVFYELRVDQEKVEVGGKVNLKVALLTRYDTRYEGFEKELDARGFFMEQTTISKDTKHITVTREGRRYVEAILKEIVLSPIYAGDLIINPGIVKVSIVDEKSPRVGDLKARRNLLLEAKPVIVHVNSPRGKVRRELLRDFVIDSRKKDLLKKSEISKPAIMLLLDISGSMMAEDFRPGNRLVCAKNAIARFLQKKMDALVGMKCFSKEVIGLAPLTSSMSEITNSLQKINFGLSPDGTSMGDAIFEAVKDLSCFTCKEKAIVLITDGSNNSGHLDPLTAVDFAIDESIVIHTVAIGKDGLVPFPVNSPTAEKKHVQVKVQPDKKALKEIADATGGCYGRAESEPELTEKLASIYKAIFK